MIQFIREESERINRMLTNFLEFAKPKPPTFQEVNLKDILRRTVDLSSIPARERGVQVVQEYPQDKVSLFLDPEQIHEAFVNLELNALEAMPAGGTLRITLTQKENKDVIIRVSDTGVGIPAGRESKIFDPFFTTKEQGTGLGLTIVHTVVKNHGGTISVANNDGGGATLPFPFPYPRGCWGVLGP